MEDDKNHPIKENITRVIFTSSIINHNHHHLSLISTIWDLLKEFYYLTIEAKLSYKLTF